jgi:regulator of protease activity HflC (stomatin/prohibitin superfamily)
MQTKQDTRQPLTYRLKRALGRPFGLRWVGDNELAVIYEMEQYHSVRGPGFFRINPLTQAVHSVIKVAPEFVSCTFPGIQTKDSLQIEVSLALSCKFDPRILPRETAAAFLKWSSETRQAIVKDNAHRALQAVVPRFWSEQIFRGDAFDLIEQGLREKLTGLLAPLALRPSFVRVKEIIPPPALKSQIEKAVGRTVDARDITQLSDEERAEARRSEIIEAVSKSPGMSSTDWSKLIPPSESKGRPPLRIVSPAPGPVPQTPLPKRPPQDASSGEQKEPRDSVLDD